MNLVTEPYLVQAARWPSSGRHILAQFDDESVIVYQAYRPAIGQFAAKNGFFGGEFSLSRMSWIKPNFLWLMYRTREVFGLSQPLFVKFLGVEVSALRHWEQGIRSPSAVVRRFLDELNATPDHWWGRIEAAVRRTQERPRGQR